MKKKLKLAGGTALLAAAIGGGAALAADRMSPAEESDAVVADVAKQLGIPEAKVEAALEEALANRVDAAVEAGRLTEAQGEELKERLRSGDFPLVGLGPGRGLHGGGHHLFGGLDAAADYLGLTEAELHEQLRDGSSLAEIAQAEGKSVDGLVAALVKSAKAKLADAVEDGRLTDAQRDELEANLTDRIEALVEREPGLGGPGGPHGPGFGRGHGPDAAAPNDA
jgi:predicted DNA-binding protein (UPF0251 family)